MLMRLDPRAGGDPFFYSAANHSDRYSIQPFNASGAATELATAGALPQ